MESKIGKPKEFTDAEAEGFIRYLTERGKEQEKKERKRKLAEAFLETEFGKRLYIEWFQTKEAELTEKPDVRKRQREKK